MKTLLTVLTLTLAFLAPAQDNLCAPQLLCTNIMEMLAGIDATKYDTYTALFIAKEDVPSLIDQMTFSEEQKDNMKKRSSGDNQEEYCRREFSALLSTGESMNVKWKDIEFKDFLYQIQMRNGIKEMKGNIYFTDGTADYQIRLQAVFYQEKFHLLELEDFRQHSETNFHDINEFIEGHEEINPAPQAPEPVPVEEVFDLAEKAPEFPGGDEALQKYIQSRLVYPQMAKEQGEQGTVYVQFVVDADGSVNNVKILRGISQNLDAEAIRVVKNMPNWIPAEQSGRKVKTRFTLPIQFRME